MSQAWERLLPRLQEMTDLDFISSLLGWDQHVIMPPGGAAGRARQMATIGTLSHQKLTDPEIGSLLDELEGDDSLDDVQSASVKILRRHYDKATKVPEAIVRELAELEGLAYEAWMEARQRSDFSIFQPKLERVLELKKEQADAIGYEGERYDALLDDYEPGMPASEVETLFSSLVGQLKPLADEILDAAGERPAFLTQEYEVDRQEAFSQWLCEALNFNKEEGRLDTSPHPFTIHVGAGDVRQTTRYLPHELLSSVKATAHETGHALYEQGIPKDMIDVPAGQVESLGLHESQSRMWEIQVVMSRAFCEYMLPQLKDRFPTQLGNVTPDEFYAGMNHPRRSMIRVEADEVTYNLHVALRFELELAMFRDELTVADLPDAWDAAMEKHVGIRPSNHAEGVLQDMHWSTGLMGYFPTYTLGTLYAAAFFAKANEELGDLSDEFRQGDTKRLLTWLREKIHSRANLAPSREIAEDILGGPLTVDPFINHIRTKYGELFGPF